VTWEKRSEETSRDLIMMIKCIDVLYCIGEKRACQQVGTTDEDDGKRNGFGGTGDVLVAFFKRKQASFKLKRLSRLKSRTTTPRRLTHGSKSVDVRQGSGPVSAILSTATMAVECDWKRDDLNPRFGDKTRLD
jgi:hypothetical protein